MSDKYDFVILHQYDPELEFKAGIEGFINDLINNEIFPDNTLLIGTGTQVKNSQIKVWNQGKVKGYSVTSGKRKLFPVSLRLFLKSFFLLITLQPKVIYVCRYDYVFPIKVLCPFSKVILSVHTDGKKLLTKESDSTWAKIGCFAKLMELMAFKFSTVVFCHSRVEYERWRDRYQMKISYIPASFQKQIFYSNSGTRNLVVWAGRLVEVKNPLLAVEVMSSLDISGIENHMYGSGSMEDEVKEAITRFGNKVQLHEAVHSVELGNVLRKTRILISTSYFEGAPRILIEALACGADIVCLSSADPHDYSREFPSNCKHILKPDSELMAQIICAQIKTKSSTFANVEHYSNESVLENLRRVFLNQIED